MRAATKSSRGTGFVVGLLVFLAVVSPACAASPTGEQHSTAPAATPPLNAAETRQLIDTLNDPTRRARLIATLEALERAAPAATAPAPAASSTGTAASSTGTAAGAPTASGSAAPATPAAGKSVVALAPDSLGAQLIARGTRLTDTLSASVLLAIRAVADIPDLLRWFQEIIEDPAVLLAGANSAGRLAGVILLAGVAELLIWWLTRRLYLALAADAHQQESAVRREAAGPLTSDPSPAAPITDGPAQPETTFAEPVRATPAAAEPVPAEPPLAPPAPAARTLDGPVNDEATLGEPAQVEPALVARPLDPGSPALVTPASAPADALPVPGRSGLTEGWLLLLRLPIILLALAVDAVPPLVFLAVATLLAGTPLAGSDDVRAVTVAVADAYVIVRLIAAAARATFAAPSARLRLLPVSDEAARYLMIWVRRIAVVIVFGYAITQLALFFGMDSDTQQGILRLLSLLVHVMLIVMVLQCRRTVAARLSGAGAGFLGTLRQRAASVWHVYAIIFIIGGWFIYAAEIHDGFDRLVRFMLLAALVGVLARVADIVLVGALDRGLAVRHGDASHLALFEARAARYRPPLRILLRTAIFLVAMGALLQAAGLDIIDWFGRGALGDRLAGSAVTLILTLGVAIVVWEAIDISVQAYLDRLSLEGAAIRAARLRTIVPLLRNALLITLMVLIVLTVMSEIGVNIGPLLAGASIFGVAIGFGSQKLVQDFITGIFLLLENAMQVGDNVTAGGLSGSVEQLSIRTLRLRAGDGSVHLIPFSSVSTVTNTNRGLGNAAVSVTVDYAEDTDRVGALLSKIATEMRAEDAFAKGMLSDLQLWGVDRVDGTTVTLAGQIVCTDSARWAVQREFNRRVKLAFQEQGIRMTPPISVTSLRHPLDIKVESSEPDGRIDGPTRNQSDGRPFPSRRSAPERSE